MQLAATADDETKDLWSNNNAAEFHEAMFPPGREQEFWISPPELPPGTPPTTVHSADPTSPRTLPLVRHIGGKTKGQWTNNNGAMFPPGVDQQFWSSPPELPSEIPPTTVHSADWARAGRLLNNWAELLKVSEDTSDEGNIMHDEVLRNMHDVIAQATNLFVQLKHGSDSNGMNSTHESLTRIKRFEMVGMVPTSSLPLVLPGLSAVGLRYRPSKTPGNLRSFDASVR